MTTPLPPALSTKVNGELWSLWLGDTSGWQIVCMPGELFFRHQCGHETEIMSANYLGNILSKWFDLRYHVC